MAQEKENQVGNGREDGLSAPLAPCGGFIVGTQRICFGCSYDLITYLRPHCVDCRAAHNLAHAVRLAANGMGLFWGDDWSEALRSVLHNGKWPAQPNCPV